MQSGSGNFTIILLKSDANKKHQIDEITALQEKSGHFNPNVTHQNCNVQTNQSNDVGVAATLDAASGSKAAWTAASPSNLLAFEEPSNEELDHFIRDSEGKKPKQLLQHIFAKKCLIFFVNGKLCERFKQSLLEKGLTVFDKKRDVHGPCHAKWNEKFDDISTKIEKGNFGSKHRIWMTNQ